MSSKGNPCPAETHLLLTPSPRWWPPVMSTEDLTCTDMEQATAPTAVTDPNAVINIYLSPPSPIWSCPLDWIV